MIPKEQAERLKEELIAALQEDAYNVDRLLRRLDTLSREVGVGAHAALLSVLTHLPFEESEAREHWDAILAHRHEMSLALARDIGIRVAVLDYFLNVNKRLTRPALIDLAVEETNRRAEGLDPVTGLATDRAFRAVLQGELRRTRRYGPSVAVAVFDLDGFAAVDARVGRLVGDRLLREAAIVLTNKIRDIDSAARPGEDEFAVLMPQTERTGALLVAERFRREIEAHFLRREVDGAPVGLTVSGGVASCPDDAGTPEDLLSAAARALYAAKASGKNTVLLHGRERRRFLRIDLDPSRWEVEVLAPRDLGARPVRDISRRGLLFACPEPLEVGESLELRLAPAGGSGERFVVRGRVVRLEEFPSSGEGEAGSVDRFDVGVAIEPAPDGTEHDLMDLIERAAIGGSGRNP